jgi:hypothetical protein
VGPSPVGRSRGLWEGKGGPIVGAMDTSTAVLGLCAILSAALAVAQWAYYRRAERRDFMQRRITDL